MASSERSSNTNRPLKPSLASTRTARTPNAPRVAVNGSATPPTKSTGSRATPTIRSEPPTPKAKQTSTPLNDVLTNANITPRSSARTSRPGSANNSPRQSDKTTSPRPKSAAQLTSISGERSSIAGVNGSTNNSAQPVRPKAFVSDTSNAQSPLIRSPGFFDLSPPATDESIESRFFHASDVQKQEPKKSQFFHADGKQEANNLSPTARSPVLSAISEQRPAGPWIRSDSTSQASRSPPTRSPALSALSGVSPFFAPSVAQSGGRTSPSQSKENIHLSYRKGVSQIIGTRPGPSARSAVSDKDLSPGIDTQERSGSVDSSALGVIRHHKKTPSVSSIESGNSAQLRRRSTTANTEAVVSPSPLVQDFKAATVSHVAKPPQDLPSIDTSLESPGVLTRTESGLSPTKTTSDLVADARRERKVLDLELSNNSLMAINKSLEREVRRQKAELKSFRRLSRAGRFSFAPGERLRTVSEDLSALTEEGEGDDYFGLGISDGNGDITDDDDDDDDDDDSESLASSADPLGPGYAASQDRLAKDEKRLQVDLEKHKELLMQSQAMNQSIRRCMYATEDMIKEGKKALEYFVRVSDVKLGGRVLSNHEENGEERQEIEVVDDLVDNTDGAKAFLETWTDFGRKSHEGSEGGDRDSGIDVVEKSTDAGSLSGHKAGSVADSGRPPGLKDLGARFGSFG